MCKKALSHFSLVLLGLATFLGAGIAHAATFTAAGTGSDGPLSASAVFTTSAGQLQVTLSNTLLAGLFVSPGQAVSDLSFTLSNAPGSLGTTTATGQLGNIGAKSSTGTSVTYVSGSPTRFFGTGTPSNPGGFNISGNTVTLEVIGGGKPSEMIAPYMANGGTYLAGNNGLQNFDPYVIGSATFTLALTGITANTTINSAVFSFGTSPDTFLQGTPVPPSPIPEPSSLLLLGSGMAAAAGLIRNRVSA